MSFLALLCALLIEQARPLAPGNALHAGMRAWVRSAARNLDTGVASHAWLAWFVAVAVPALMAVLVHWALLALVGWPLAMLWNVAVLYAALGFRQFSHHFTGLREALEEGDDALARERLAHWQQVDVQSLPRTALLGHVIEFSVLAAHRHVFGVLGWFSVLAALGLGPAGAVAYRLSEFVARYWRHKARTGVQPLSPALQGAAARAWHVMDWLPARGTALAFAVVGSFEDAIDGWRHHAQRFPDDNDGVILAATAGAIDVRLGGERLSPRWRPESSQGFQAQAVPEPTPGREPALHHLRSVVGLVWRAVVLWMLLLALLTLARLIG